MKRIIWAAAIIIILAACFPAFADVVGKTNEEVRAIAEPIVNSILEGFNADDYAKFSKDFDDTMKEALPNEKFLKTNKQMKGETGNYKSREYLGFLNKAQYAVVLWKGKFDKTSEDVLIKLVLSKRGDKYVVAGLWFE